MVSRLKGSSQCQRKLATISTHTCSVETCLHAENTLNELTDMDLMYGETPPRLVDPTRYVLRTQQHKQNQSGLYENADIQLKLTLHELTTPVHPDKHLTGLGRHIRTLRPTC
ncbi:hypothetical protein L9F63_017036, partial [Diploptera punctata]